MEVKPRRISYSHILIAYVLGVLLLQPFFWMSPEHENKIRNAFLWPSVFAAFCTITWTVWKNPKHAGKLIIGLLLPVWLFTTNILNGDPYLILNQKFIMGVFLTFGVCFPALMLAEPNLLVRGLKYMGWCAVLLFAAIAGLGVFLVFTGRSLSSPFLNNAMGIIYGRLYVFTLHPNEIACVFTGVLFWAVYLLTTAKRTLCRVVLAIACLCLFTGTALTVSNTGKLSTTTGLVLVAVLLMRRYGPGKQSLRIVFTVVVACAVAAISIACFSGVISAASNALHTQKPTQTLVNPAPLISPAPPEEEQPVDIIDFVQPTTPNMTPVARDIRTNLGTFSDRTSIWKAGLEAIREHPKILLIGMTDGQVARVPYNALNRDIYHMHNAWVEMLLLGGLPGLLLYVLFCVQLVVKCIHIYCSKKQPLSTQILAIAPAVLLVHCLMEIYPTFAGTAMDMVFALLAGAVIAISCDMPKVPKTI